MFTPTRTAALEKLTEFLPHAGRDYAAKRNFDVPGHPHVSTLSPYVRHRVLSEADVLQATLARHSLKSAEKFVQEVFWRTYWKGWLEMRPGVWRDYQRGLKDQIARAKGDARLKTAWDDACDGRTGIDCFDHWAHQLRDTGYLHNHARMWFASIWIFTLGLPWQLGADFFMRHLLDGDPASNTLSWRWVGGLQTLGKTYAATSSNITKFTEGRFAGTHGLAKDAPALPGMPHPDRSPIRPGGRIPADAKVALVVHDDDLDTSLAHSAADQVVGFGICLQTHRRSPLPMGDRVTQFADDLATDTAHRAADRFGDATRLKAPDIATWAQDLGATVIALPFAPVGPNADVADQLRQGPLPVVELKRPYDDACWPYATAGFFKFKEKIPRLVTDLGLDMGLDLG